MPGATNVARRQNRNMVGGPAKATHHITDDRLKADGTRAATLDGVTNYLLEKGYEPQVIIDPFTGDRRAMLDAESSGYALQNQGVQTNRAGTVNLQVEWFFTPGTVYGGVRYAQLADTPMLGLAEFVAWAKSWGVPAVPAMAPNDRDPRRWTAAAGHVGHFNAPGNSHVDPISSLADIFRKLIKEVPMDQVPQVVLVPAHSDYVLDVEWASKDNGARIMQYGLNANANQRWIIEDLGAAEWRIRSAGSGRVLDVVGAGVENGSGIQQWDWHGGANQRWKIEVVGNHRRFVTAQRTARPMVLDIAGVSTEKGAVLQLWELLDGPNQLFELVHADALEAVPLVLATPPVQPPPAAAELTNEQAGDQINRWNFFGGVRGFQTTMGIGVDGVIGRQTRGAVKALVDAGGQLRTNFHLSEFRCSHCGRVFAEVDLLNVLQAMRDQQGAMGKFSSFRCPEHPIEAAKDAEGRRLAQHPKGRAWDPDPNPRVSFVEGFAAVQGIGYAAADRGRCTHLDAGGRADRVYFQDN